MKGGGSDGGEREWNGGGREWSGVMEGGRGREGEGGREWYCVMGDGCLWWMLLARRCRPWVGGGRS